MAVVVILGGALAACEASSCRSAPPERPRPSEAERARALLETSAILPARPEIVAVADALAIESSREGRTPSGASLAKLAADLRVRAWRLDGAAADAREAIELYGAAANAVGGTVESCQIEHTRALLVGELAHDASVTFRELYVVRHRHASSPVAAPCVAALDRDLAMLAAFRPSAETLRALESDAARQAPVVPAKTAAPAVGSAATTASTPAPLSAAGPRDVVVAPAEDAAHRPVRITGIERYGSEQAGRVVVQLSGPTTFQVGSLAADDAAGKDARVYVDVARASAKGMPKEIEVGGVVRRVRLGARDGGTRVVLDLTATPFRRVFYLPDPFRIVIDVSTRPPVADDGSGKREVRRVALDPGHGGHDHGAVGPTGLREKDVALDIAHRVAPLLARELQIETLLTRDNDTFVPLELRTARANAFHADLFVSIHCNASEDGHARGVQTFYLDEARSRELPLLRIAARENASRGAALDPASLDAAFSPVLSGLGVGRTAAVSRHLADLVQRAALASLAPRYPDVRDQGVKSAGFFVLAGADMPAVLFETSFISNPEDEGRLATADYRQKMADAIVNAVRAFRDGK